MTTSKLFTGDVNGNPFIVLEKLNQELSSKTYYGSTDVTYRKKDEKITETLSASITKSYPIFGTKKYILFASDAAPNLTFFKKANSSLWFYDKSSYKESKKN
ncbi:hypothetical protein [Mesomycoplasma neurolyticum]|uniref:Uncharacterized protein n=1 Tax=Mesomycoplasma neurolyticum TaxID=2120 RepID=A0A449A4F2_9BACT|nr:hypothetical protein [Mesomycoplasma neurolyticum]VEU59160.1 Uncharacterised protein [Mesomycoplasma neurolyticum]